MKKPNHNGNKKSNIRRGSAADIATLTIDDWIGRRIERIRCSVHDKAKGIFIQDLIDRYFNLTQADKYETRKKMREKEKKDFEDMEKEAKEFKDNKSKTKVDWNRDNRGNLSPKFPFKKINF